MAIAVLMAMLVLAPLGTAACGAMLLALAIPSRRDGAAAALRQCALRAGVVTGGVAVTYLLSEDLRSMAFAPPVFMALFVFVAAFGAFAALRVARGEGIVG